MNLKEAVVAAKSAIIDLFGDEGISEVGLEEVVYDEQSATWRVTIGFRRPWTKTDDGPLSGLTSAFRQTRWYKVVTLAAADGSFLGVTDHELRRAA